MKDRIKQIETTTVCCVCGGHISGPWPARTNDLSHGYCAFHYQRAMQEIQAYLALTQRQQNTAIHALAA
jgi:hypothetical protein